MSIPPDPNLEHLVVVQDLVLPSPSKRGSMREIKIRLMFGSVRMSVNMNKSNLWITRMNVIDIDDLRLFLELPCHRNAPQFLSRLDMLQNDHLPLLMESPQPSSSPCSTE